MLEEETKNLRKLKLLLAGVGGSTVVQIMLTDATLVSKVFHSATLLLCLEGVLPFSLFGLVTKVLDNTKKEDTR